MAAPKGHKRYGGRVAGTPNRMTIEARATIEGAAAMLGGVKGLVEWANRAPENEYAFWTTIFPKLLPLQIRGGGTDGALVLELTGELLSKKLEERGLPVEVFGAEVPRLEDFTDAEFVTDEKIE